MPRWRAGETWVCDDGRPRVMGIVNATPDSFSDGGRFFEADTAVRHARKLIADGADILDIGGESSRPGAAPVSLDEERRRILPVIEALADDVGVPISVDTAKPVVAREALARGASIVNDIGGLRDPEMLGVVAASQAGVVIMHMAGTPTTMQIEPRFDDVVGEVHAYLAERIEAARAAGIAHERIAIDPGIGFGKTSAHNVALLHHLERFATLGCALLVGTSRKRFLGALTNRPVEERVGSSIVSSLAAVLRGANVVRVHDVAAMADALIVWRALMGGDGAAWRRS